MKQNTFERGRERERERERGLHRHNAFLFLVYLMTHKMRILHYETGHELAIIISEQVSHLPREYYGTSQLERL